MNPREDIKSGQHSGIMKTFFLILVLVLLFGCVQTEQEIPQAQSETITVFFEVKADSQFLVNQSLEVESGTTALQALQELTQVEVKAFEFGSFVTSIGGVDSGTQSYWAFYLNEVYAEKGLDQTILSDGDRVRLVLEKIE